MKLEKRSDGSPQEPVEETSGRGRKPVVVYIMVLFIVAFLLMAWSFVSHQRSNTEALGRLQSSVSTMQEIQEIQDQMIALQKELADAKKRVEALEDQSAAQQQAVETLEKQAAAMERLYILQQQYSSGDYEACRQTIALFEEEGCQNALPKLADGSVTAPADRYQQLKEAVSAHADGDGAS